MTGGDDKPPLRVSDRRAAGEESSKPDSPAEPEPSAAGKAPEAGAEKQAAPGDDAAALPEVDFVTFVLSLSTSAMVSLGALPQSEGEKAARNLPLARQTIDILGMLQDKTRGNLTGEEERILDSVLYDLRMTYVMMSRPGK